LKCHFFALDVNIPNTLKHENHPGVTTGLIRGGGSHIGPNEIGHGPQDPKGKPEVALSQELHHLLGPDQDESIPNWL